MFDNLQFIKDSSQWPKMSDGNMRFCALRNDDEKLDLGFLLTFNGWEVFLGNVFSGGNGQTIQYNSPEDIVKAGWYVD